MAIRQHPDSAARFSTKLVQLIGASRVRELFVLAFLVGCGGGESSEDFLASGRKLLDAGDTAGAIIQFKNALQKQPDSGEVRYLLGSALQRSGSAQQAVVEYRKAIEQGYDPAKLRPELLAAVLSTGDFATVVTDAVTEGITDPSAKAQVLALAGDALIALGRRDEAIERYTEASKLDPGSEGAGIGQVTIALTAGDAPKAKALLEDLVAKHPASVRGQLLLGGVLVQTGDAPAATKAFDAVIAQSPADARAYLGLIPVLIANKDIAGAKTRIAKLEAAVPSGIATTYLKALIAYAEGKKEAARELVRLVVKAMPDDLRALLLAGSVEFDLGNHVLAEQYLAKLLVQNPADNYARRLLAATRVQLGNPEKAWEVIAPVVKSGKADGPALLIASQIAIARSDRKAAIDYVKRAVELEPQVVAYRTALGQMQLQTGDREAGIASLKAAIASDPKLASADLVLIGHLLQTDRKREALVAAEELVRRLPESAMAQSALGTALLAGGEEAKARTAFQKALAIDPASEDAARSLAQLSARDGDVAAAQKFFEAVLEKRPASESSAIQLALLQARAGAGSEVVLATLDKLIVAAPASERARIAKLQYLLQEQRVRDAFELAQKSVAEIPESATLLQWLARIQLTANETAQAVTTYGKLSQRMPQSPVPFLGLVAAHSMDKNWPAALDAARKAVTIAPDVPEVQLALVAVNADAGKWVDGRNAAKDIQRKWPKRPEGYAAEARVFIVEKDLDAAERVLRAGIDATGDDSLVDALYEIVAQAGRIQEAEKFGQAWIASHPKATRAALRIADGRLRAGDHARAAAWYGRASAIEPDNVIVLNNWAWVLGKLNDDRALDVGRRALEKAPRNAAVLDTVGMLYAQKGDPQKGLEYLQQAVKFGGRSHGLRLNLARVLAQVGKKDEARAQLDSALKEARTPLQKQEITDLRGTL
jgi:cellulose synthase operon protein C